MSIENRYVLRDTPRRVSLIGRIESLCKQLHIPIEVDLREYHYSELMLAYIKLQLASPVSKS